MPHKPIMELGGLCSKTEHRWELREYEGELSLPPSVNASLQPAWNHKGLVKTKEARNWAALAASQLGRAPVPLDGPLRLSMHFWVRSVVSDISNRIKALEDALVYAGYLHDDCQIVELAPRKSIARLGRHTIQSSGGVSWRLEKWTADDWTTAKIAASKKATGR